MAVVNDFQIEFSAAFKKKLKLLPREIIESFYDTLGLFIDDPNHPALRRHLLKAEYAGYQSIDVTDDFRAIFKEVKTENYVLIKFQTIGTHQELYK